MTDEDRLAGARGEVIERKDGDDGVDERIDQLTRELAEAINEAEAEGRVVMRDYAIDLLRDEVETQAQAPADGTVSRSSPPLNPFALGIPVLLIGVVLTFIFTPVGVALLLLGTLTCVIGVLMAVARSARDRWRSGSEGK